MNTLGRTDLLLDSSRRYLDEGIGPRNLDVLCQVLTSDYQLFTGGTDIVGRDRFLSILTDYLDQEPTVDVVLHEVIANGDHVGLRMTKHTTAPRAAWDAVLIFAGREGRICRGWTEQDWLTYGDQVRGATVPETAGVRGWTLTAAPPDPDTQAVGTAWLEKGGAVERDVVAAERVYVNVSFTAGSRFAFHVTAYGRYVGGLRACQPFVGHQARLHVAGVGAVTDGAVSEVHSVSDRSELRRRLLQGVD